MRAIENDLPIPKKLRYGSDLHAKVLERIKARLKLAYDAMSDRYDEWDRVDEHIRLYMNLERSARAGDKGTIYNADGSPKREMPFERSVVIPVSYVVLSVRLSQLMHIVLGRDPMWSLEGRGPEDVQPSRLMEACLNYDMQQCAAILTLYQFFMDAEKYGLGVIYDTWTEEYGWKRLPISLPGLDPGLFRTWDVVKEYNNWVAIDPFKFWPDPRVPRADLQKGEFVGHRVERSYLWILERSIKNGGPYFNVDFLPELKTSAVTKHTPRRDDLLAAEPKRTSQDPDDKGYYYLDHFQIRLIPKEWELGPEEKPEIWWFTIANEALIIRAHPSSYDHGQFTYAVGESNPDLHTPFNPGNIENLEGIQRFMNWLLNSHFENIRKSLNDVLIYAPSYLEVEDLLNPGPARHIRLSQRGEELVEMGVSPEHFVRQLAVADITTPHLQASQFLWEMVARMFATNDPEIGVPTQEKKTLGEIQQFLAGSSKRVAVAFRLYEVMALQPLVMRAVANRQQFTTLEQYYRITGELMMELGSPRHLIGPSDIQGNFDYAPRSELLPPDPAKTATAWSQILFGLAKFPQLWAPGPDGKVLDPRLIFNEVARNLGVKHVNQFYRQLPPMMMPPGPPPRMQIMPDERVQKEVQKGNLVGLQ